MTEAPLEANHPEDPFTPEDVAQFDADDAEAGSAIGRMLTLFFFYTVVAMTITGLCTWFEIF